MYGHFVLFTVDGVKKRGKINWDRKYPRGDAGLAFSDESYPSINFVDCEMRLIFFKGQETIITLSGYK